MRRDWSWSPPAQQTPTAHASIPGDLSPSLLLFDKIHECYLLSNLSLSLDAIESEDRLHRWRPSDGVRAV